MDFRSLIIKLIPILRPQSLFNLPTGILALLALTANILPLAFIWINLSELGFQTARVAVFDVAVKQSAFMLCAGVTLGAALIVQSFKKQDFVFPRWLFVPVGLLGVGFLLSCFQATNLWHAVWVGGFIYVLPMALFVLLSLYRGQPQQVQIFFMACLPAAVVTAVIGCWQFFDPTGWVSQWPHYAGVSVGALLFNPNLAAEYLVLIVPMLMALIWLSRPLVVKSGLTLLLLLLLVHLVLTQARGAWVGLSLGLLVTVVLVTVAQSRQRGVGFCWRPVWFLWPVVILLVLIYTSPWWTLTGSTMHIEELSHITPAYDGQRFSIWKDSLAMLADYWLWGAGPDHYRVLYPHYLHHFSAFTWQPHLGEFIYPLRAHQDFLQLWIELGLLGFLGFVSLIGLVVWRAWIVLNKALATQDRSLLIVWMACFSIAVCWGTGMFLQFPLRMPATAYLGSVSVAFLLGLSLSASQHIAPGKIKTLSVSRRVLRVTLGSAIILGSVLIGLRVMTADRLTVKATYAVQKEQFMSAEESLLVSLSLTPWNAQTAMALSRLYVMLGRHQEVLLLADYVLKKNPYLLPMFMYKADALLKIGERRQAAEVLREVVKLFPYLPETATLKQGIVQLEKPVSGAVK